MIATQGNYLNMKRKRKKEMKSRKHETVLQLNLCNVFLKAKCAWIEL